MANFVFLSSTPDFSSFSSVAVSAVSRPLRHLRCHLPRSGRLSVQRLALWESSREAGERANCSNSAKRVRGQITAMR